ncbi:MAG: dihydroneopterin aldolase [Planctomycetota bacterium]
MAERPRRDQIHIRDLRLRCIIGVYPEERHERQEVVVSVTLYADLRAAGQSDRLEDTVDYKAVKQSIVAMVEQSDCQLVERLAQRVADTCLAAPGVEAARVEVQKPGALRFARTVAVEVCREKAGE